MSAVQDSTSSDSIDFSAFLAEDFNVKEWINGALSSINLNSNTFPSSGQKDNNNTIEPDETKKFKFNERELLILENHASDIVEKLQYLNQGVSHRLENTIEDIVKNMPSIMTELQIIQQNSENLKESVALVKSSLGNVENNTGKAIERLKYLDLVKTRMELSRDVLREAENWSNLEAEASTIFASQDYQKAAIRLQEAEKSLVIFHNTPEYEERRKLLTELQNQLEATVSPQLVAALSQHDISACQKFFTIFSQIGRKKEFCNYYYGSRKAPLVKVWQNASLIDINSTVVPKFIEFLQEFFHELFVVLNEEYTWCGNIFPDANETIISLIENIFNSLKPSLGVRLAGLVEHYHEQCLPEIINAFIVKKRNGGSLDLEGVMADNIGKIFSMAESALQRCMTLTHGFAGVGLVDVLNYYFAEFIKEYQSLLDQLRIDCGLKENTQTTNFTSMNRDYFDFDQDRLQQEDWSNFQIGLRLLATCRLASDKLNNFEMTVKFILSTVLPLINQDDDSLNEDLEWYERKSSTIPNLSKTLSIGTQSSILLLKQSPLNSYQLYELLSNLESRELLEPSKRSIGNFIRSSQRFVYDTIFLPIVKHLVNLPMMEVWKATAELAQVSPFNLEIPTFSLSPSEYITRVGEHLLTLPQQFEVYADDKSLAFSIKSLPYSDAIPMQTDITTSSSSSNILKDPLDAEGLSSITIVNEDGIANEDKSITTTITTITPSSSQLIDQEEEISTEEVTHAWITSVARGTMHALLEGILAIPQLSSHGNQQLLTDLGYLTNVLSALDILPTRELFMAVKVLEMDEDKVGSDEFLNSDDREILIKVASVR
ncbi:1487_t:CDS:2, partial [Diversispora eburnea]